MTEKELLEIAACGETSKVQFKELLDNQASVAAEMVAMSNSKGGQILFGIKDKTGEIVKYKVYNTFIVQPTDVACTSQLTNGKREITLITCSDGGKTRLVVKCREIE